MVTIIHGDDLVSSRNFFLDKKTKENGILFDGSKLYITDIIQAFEGESLFFETKDFFVEDFFAKRKQDAEYQKILDYIKNNEEKINITFWEGKDVGKAKTGIFKKPLVKTFKLPQSLFLFLDSLRPNAGPNLIRLFHQSIKTTEVRILFSMLIRQIRLLIALSENGNTRDVIDEVKRLAPWQKSKLAKQAGYFSTQELLKIHEALYKMDLASKTSSFPLSLTETIDFFLLDL